MYICTAMRKWLEKGSMNLDYLWYVCRYMVS
ncbi:hypothetical protein F383_29819 [Gossypium arboreum]|uniref:Uncharacterized protein n=1 Tax=Gossypium arboreum TaxID=29729 RepID=A0A0B0PIP3_GOSAR|nr:hypothetical protein F383_29819 [Gossypium arboreum]